MNTILQITWIVIETIAISVFSPFFWIVIILVIMQYRNKVAIEREIMGIEQEPIKELVLDSVFYGVIAATIGSLIMVFLGITIENIGLQYVWPLAILLMFISPRYICFSYSGGIISLVSLIFGTPKISVPALMAIVGILHLMESLLIYIDGWRTPTPIFIRLKDGRIAGGFTMQKFWPIPFAALTVVSAVNMTGELIHMPEWWPVLKPEGIDPATAVFLIIPAVAALGYGDLALTRLPEEKTRLSSKRLFFFSGMLILLAVLGIYERVFQYVAAVFAPVAHEFLIIIGQKEEKDKPPIFVAPDTGLMVLTTAKDSPARQMGIKPGDIILSVNGAPVNEPEDIIRVIEDRPTMLWITVKDLKGHYTSYEYRDPEGVYTLGILTVPKTVGIVYDINEDGIILRKLKALFKNIFKKGE